MGLQITGLLEESKKVKVDITDNIKCDAVGKKLFLIILTALLILLQNGFTQERIANTKNENICVKARVIKITKETQDNVARSGLAVVLKLEFINISGEPVVLLTKKGPYCPRAVLTKTPGPAAGENILYDLYRGPSVNTSPEWKAFHEALDQPRPPVGIVQVLKPGDSWVKEIDITLRLPIEKEESYRADRPAASWAFILQNSSIWFRVGCETWPFNIENNPLSDEFQFGHELQQRWLQYGSLQLDSLVSEPIELNLKSLDLLKSE
jgi:hypothetical protein